MAKWADYLISEVQYSSIRRLIQKVKQHEDLDGSVSNSKIIDRAIVASNLKQGKSYMTIHNGISETWKRGKKITTFRLGEEYFIRSDENKVKRDNLEDLIEF